MPVAGLRSIEYKQQFKAVENHLAHLDTKVEELNTLIADRLLMKNKLQAFTNQLKASNQLVTFDEGMFLSLTEIVLVYTNKLVFVFKDGTKIGV